MSADSAFRFAMVIIGMWAVIYLAFSVTDVCEDDVPDACGIDEIVDALDDGRFEDAEYLLRREIEIGGIAEFRWEQFIDWLRKGRI